MKLFYKLLLAHFFMGLPSLSRAASLKLGVEQSNTLIPSPFLSNVLHCNFSQKTKAEVKSAKPSKIWDLDLKDIKFQNGIELTEENVNYSLSQASPIQRSLLFSVAYRKNHLGIIFKLPVSDPLPFLKWHITASKPSLYCGNWTVLKEGVKPIALERANQRIHWVAEKKDVLLERLRKGEIDVFVPETWTQIESFLKRNPHIKTISSKRPQKLRLYLNPRKLPDLAFRKALFETLQKLPLPFPFAKQTAIQASKSPPPSKSDASFVLGVPAHAEWLLASKAASASLLSHFKNPSIKVLDPESLYSEIKSGSLDAWVDDQELGPFTYHSQVAVDLYGPSGWSLPTLDLLIERAHSSEGEPAHREIIEVLKQNGIMLEIATIHVAALASKKTLEAKSQTEKIAEILEDLRD